MHRMVTCSSPGHGSFPVTPSDSISSPCDATASGTLWCECGHERKDSGCVHTACVYVMRHLIKYWNWFSLRCQKHTHTCMYSWAFLKHTAAFKVCSHVSEHSACESAKVCPLVVTMSLKPSKSKSKHCSKYKREAEEQKQRRAHTVRRRGFTATEERLKLRHTARQELRN